MSKKIKLCLLLLFILQVVIAVNFELAHDEAYYWLYSRHLDWGFFDHPPLVGLIIKCFSFLPHSEFSVRIGFIILQFGTIYLLLNLTSFSSRALWLFFSFPLASFAGLFALPDMGLLFMTACYCYGLKKYLEDDSRKNILILSVIIPLLLYAKYHGVLLLFFTLVAIPSLFWRKSFYSIFLISLLLFLPHILWQYHHDFSTLRYHFLERPRADFSSKRLLEYLALQVGLPGLFLGPVVWKIVLTRKIENSFDRAMKIISIGTVIFFLVSTLSKKFEANWTIFLTVPLIYLSANSEVWRSKLFQGLLGFSLVFVLLSRALLVMPSEWIELRRIREFHGWGDWSKSVEKLCEGAPISANSYQIASKLSFYLNVEIGSINYRSRKNQFDYWRFDKLIPTDTICYVTDKLEFGGEVLATPDGKRLRLIKKMSLKQLLSAKM